MELNATAIYDYDRGTPWKREGEDFTSTYRMAAYLKNIESKENFQSLSKFNQKKVCKRLAQKWHEYGDYYTMKLTLTKIESNKIRYDMHKSGFSTCCSGLIVLDTDVINLDVQSSVKSDTSTNSASVEIMNENDSSPLVSDMSLSSLSEVQTRERSSETTTPIYLLC